MSEQLEREIASMGRPKMTKYRASRVYRRCDTREIGCTNIEPGQRYARYAFPPHSEPLYSEGWSVLVECEACAEYCGRPVPRKVER